MEWYMGMEHRLNCMIYRARRQGLNDGHMAVWRALDRLSLESNQLPTFREIADAAGYSRGTVATAVRVLESLGYVQLNRTNGRIRRRGVVLLLGPDDVALEEAG